MNRWGRSNALTKLERSERWNQRRGILIERQSVHLGHWLYERRSLGGGTPLRTVIVIRQHCDRAVVAGEALGTIALAIEAHAEGRPGAVPSTARARSNLRL